VLLYIDRWETDIKNLKKEDFKMERIALENYEAEFNFVKSQLDNLQIEINKEKENIVSKFEIAKNEELAIVDAKFADRTTKLNNMFLEVSTEAEEVVEATEEVEENVIEEVAQEQTEVFQGE